MKTSNVIIIHSLVIMCVYCIISCSPKDTKNTTDAPTQEELTVEQMRLDAASKLASEKFVGEESEKLRSEKANLNLKEKAGDERLPRAEALEEKAASARAARAKLINTQFDSLTLSNGDVYDKVVVRKITDQNLSISHDSGISTIRMSELTPQDQKRFHYDKELVEAVSKAQSAQPTEFATRTLAPQSDAIASEKQAKVDANKAALLRLEIAKEEDKLAEMKSSLVRLKTDHQNVINEFNEETSNAQRIKDTRYDRIAGNERYGGISTSKADRQMKIDAAGARVSAGENLIRQVEVRIRSLKSQL